MIHAVFEGRNISLLNKPGLHTKQLNVLISNGQCAVIDGMLYFMS